MRIAITGAGSRLGHALAAALAGEHELRLADAPGSRLPVDMAGGSERLERVEGDLRQPDRAAQVAEGCCAIIHLAAHPESWPADLAEGEVLDLCARGTFELLRAAVAAGVPRVVLGSTLDLMEAYPQGWAVHEGWRPRPSTAMADLGPYAAELSVREMTRAGWPLVGVCLRLGRLVGAQEVRAGRVDARSLHLDEAVEALRRALDFQPAGAGRRDGSAGWLPPERAGWWVFHVPGGARARFPLAAAASPAFGYAPRHDFGGTPAPAQVRAAVVGDDGRLNRAGAGAPLAGRDPGGEAGAAAGVRPGRPIRRLAVFGASGPLASAAAPLLAPSHTLRLTDLLPPEEGARRIGSRWPAAPRPVRLPAPHECRQVDVSDGAAVLAAAEGMDALVNCTVVREHPEGAFRVNTVGAYNVVRAAVAHGIRRVVHTGPQILSADHPAGYGPDFDVPDEVPPRVGASVYFHSKYLGMEICRAFAENHGLEVAALLFSNFVNPDEPGTGRGHLGPATVSWSDAGLAVRRAIEVPALPSPFEMMRILGDMPHGAFSSQKARRVLGWAPRDSLLHLWQSDAKAM
jgi:nucleoside-diphosphate-sugar epimerase